MNTNSASPWGLQMTMLVSDWLKIVVLKGEGGKFVIGKKLDMQAAIHNCIQHMHKKWLWTSWIENDSDSNLFAFFMEWNPH